MRTVKWSALLSGFCAFALSLGVITSSAHAIVTTERGSSILVYPKVVVSEVADTIIQIANTSNNMVHARCFYVNAAPDAFGAPQWQVTDFHIWLTKQQPTSWIASQGRFVNAQDNCEQVTSGDNEGLLQPDLDCLSAGIDPGAVPPLSNGFQGELKCVEVDVSNSPLGGNHLKGEATLRVLDRVSGLADTGKYNAIGIRGTEIAGETGNELLLNQPSDTEDVIGQYNACPDRLIVNHLTEMSTDPTVLGAGRGGACSQSNAGVSYCIAAADCCDPNSGGFDACINNATCDNGPDFDIAPDGTLRGLISANLTELTLIPCSQNFEEPFRGVQENAVTVQFETYNEFEQVLSFSTTVECWKKFFLYQLDERFNPLNSQFSYGTLGTLGAQTQLVPNPDKGGILGVASTLRADSSGNIARTMMNVHMEGDRWSASGGEIVDRVILSGQ